MNAASASAASPEPEEGSVHDLAAAVGFELPLEYNASRLLWDNLPARAGRVAVRSDVGELSYAELAELAARIGNRLLAGGCAAGERVLLFMDDVPAYPAAIMGAMRAGLVPMLINTLSPPELVRFYLEDSDAKAVIVSPAHAHLFDAATVRGTACRDVLVADDAPAWRDSAATLHEWPTTRTDMAFWMYSSGSTGKPKGVVHRHEDAAYTAHTYARHVLRLAEGDACFSVPKIFFAYGFGNSVSFPFAVGGTSVLMAGRPDPAAIYEQVRAHRPTVLFGLPTLYTALARHASADAADLSSVRLCVSAAEVLSEDVAEAWRARFGHAIVEGLGSTEMLHIYLSNDERERRTGSAGRVVPGYEVRLSTPGGRTAAVGEEGLMAVRGLSGALMYWNRPDKTAATMRGGWIETGDRFVADADGFHYFRGRADDLVKVSGQWVHPLEIELCLAGHPDVHEACVMAVELPDGRTSVSAWVSARDGIHADDALRETLKRHAQTALLPHKYPREIVFVAALPKTGTDKLDRQALLRGDVPALGAAPAPAEGARR